MTICNPIRVTNVLTCMAFVLFISGCAQTRVVDSWQSGQGVDTQPEKVAVIAVLPDVLWRKSVEMDVARMMTQQGSPAVASSTLDGLARGVRGQIDVERATELLKQNNVDGIVVMFFAGGGTTDGYVRSDYWLQFLGSGMGYNWGRPYFVTVHAVRQGPGWTDTREYAYVESSYYDLGTQEPTWRIVTFTKDVEHTDKLRDIARQIARQMRSSGLN